jgi:hypothetical protein
MRMEHGLVIYEVGRLARVSVIKYVNKSNHPMKNLLLFATEIRTRDSILVFLRVTLPPLKFIT